MKATANTLSKRRIWILGNGFCRRFLGNLWLAAVLLVTPQVFAQVVIFSEDFEGSFPASGGWTVGDTDPFGQLAYWSTVDAAFGGEGTHSGIRKAYCAGVGFGGTTGSPTYQNDMSAFMSRPINLGGLTAANLTFWFKVPSIESQVEQCRVVIDDTVVWMTNDVVSAWTQVNVNLSGFVGGLRTLKFEFRSDASVDFEGWYVDDVLVTGTLGMGPPNDFFTNAFLISGSSGRTNGSNVGATKEGGEPDIASNPGGKSVWYRWTPSASGTAIIDTIGSSFDTLLGVYTGANVASLTLIADNDEIVPEINSQSRVTFSVIAGTTYRIAVDGYYGATGSVVLNWANVSGPPVNDNFSNATVLSGSAGSTNGLNINATKQSGEPNHAFNTGGSSVWYQWTAPAGGQVTFNTLGSTFDTLLGVYTGSAVGSLTVVATNDDISISFDQSQVTFTAAAGTTYRIAVDGYNGAVGMVMLNWAQGVPANDNFSNAIALNGPSGTINGNNFNATMEVGEPNHAGEVGGHSVWYRWTAPSSGTVSFDTAGSALDTLLAVYTGSQVANLSLVASNHYAGVLRTSQLDFNATAGVVYHIAVDGFDGAEWIFSLNWRPKTQPHFTAIAPRPGGGFQITVGGGSGDHYEIQTSSDLGNWTTFQFVTNVTGTVQFTDPSISGARFYRALLGP